MPRHRRHQIQYIGCTAPLRSGTRDPGDRGITVPRPRDGTHVTHDRRRKGARKVQRCQGAVKEAPLGRWAAPSRR